MHLHRRRQLVGLAYFVRRRLRRQRDLRFLIRIVLSCVRIAACIARLHNKIRSNSLVVNRRLGVNRIAARYI